jgi:predicted secreted protein
MASVLDDRISPREFGRLESEVATLTELVKAQTTAMQLMNTRLDTMNQTLTEARGGWRMLLMLGGAVSIVSAGLGYFLTHTINITPKP